MGGRAHGLDLARPLAVDGVPSRLARESKLDRALVIALALAEVLVEAASASACPA